ncbi:hemolysin family protein [Fodinicola feengrottensis]|uniref:hemolysin family protein n=1 Tax=Fodinicola feengrottensis TaxID=435914 RepID=UPI002442E6C9|nr:CBS domain-containing protein [Fodinicola feengrottensis]
MRGSPPCSGWPGSGSRGPVRVRGHRVAGRHRHPDGGGGELVPKNLAIAQPDRLAVALGRTTVVYLAIAGPVIRLFDATSNRLLRMVGIEPVEELADAATTADLDHIIAASRDEGLLDADLSALLERALDFGSRSTVEVMVPRVDVVTARADAPATSVIDLLDTGHSRFPVIGTDIDDLVGVVAVADVIAIDPAHRSATTIASLATDALVVPETLSLPDLLELLRSARRQLAVVIDEYGGFAGVVSLEDIAEELVGDIRDETDRPEPAAQRESDGSWLVPGRWRLDEVATATGISLPDHSVFDTVSGLVLHRLGRTAAVADDIAVALAPTLDPDGYPVDQGMAQLTVTAVRRHVPATVRLRRLPPEGVTPAGRGADRSGQVGESA